MIGNSLFTAWYVVLALVGEGDCHNVPQAASDEGEPWLCALSLLIFYISGMILTNPKTRSLRQLHADGSVSEAPQRHQISLAMHALINPVLSDPCVGRDLGSICQICSESCLDVSERRG